MRFVHRPLRHAATCLALGAFVLLAGVPTWPASIAEAKPAKHKPKKPRITEDESWGSAPSVRYAGLTKTECKAELGERKIRFEEVDEARGVVMPIRVKGPIGGVSYHTELPKEERARSPYEIMDCRLALSLDDFSVILKKHQIDEVQIFSAYRPPAKTWDKDKPAIRHPGGLAIDLRRFVKRDGAEERDLVVLRDWTPARDTPPCGAEKKKVGSAAQQELRAIFCEADEQRIFTSQLSPNYDKAHENHFHMELRPGVKWRLVL